MKQVKFIVVLLLLTGYMGLHQLSAQITIAPSFVFIDEKSGVGNLYVSNNSEQAHEISISFAFGYPGGDADGNLVMNYNDSAAYARFALDPMIRAFPGSFVLKGGEQRTVRLQVIPAERRKEGYFYTRLKVLAKPQAAEITQEVAEGISTRINFNFEQITAVFYKHGKVSTGLKIKNVDVQQTETQVLELRAQLERTGNAPFLGSMTAKLKDAKGTVVAEIQSATTAYFDVTRRLDLNIKDVPSGDYTLELSFETQRNDMMKEDLLQAPRVVYETKVHVK